MGKDYSEILSSMEKDVKVKNYWIDWKRRIDNLIDAAIEIAHSKEDWAIWAVLDTAKEKLNSNKGDLLEQLFQELDWGNEQEGV